jgi:uncharacterized cupin superfamily protein
MALPKAPLVQSLADAPVRPVAGGSVAVRLRGEHTGGSLALIENVLPAGFGGMPLHVHPAFDEAFYVLEGELTFRYEQDGAVHSVVAGPGDAFTIPTGVGHAFSVTSPEPARYLIIGSPAGIDAFFADAGEAIPAPVLPDADEPPAFDRERLVRAFEKYGAAHYDFPAAQARG